ncbi:hypothetical protein LTS18_012937 [Coniosporium uncinatum]|uniref:Uncharacterized protein n=1 Tax=Coniosporium uncinatum TaxID=93489 RepID=A0ACC3DIE2_9PEZI|nr:hypothetical protein LTS18_012937 [Coniosporium uncinatum]
MAHIANHASARIESMDLTRCTTITDQGFQSWSIFQFPRLRRLVLADCTYLTDNSIVYLCGAAKGLRELDLSFCCALSDTATEVLSLGLPALERLNLAFCGSAVSDSSLRAIGLHLLELKELSVRGCVRVTPTGVESVVRGCTKLEVVDVSQCRNLEGWSGLVAGNGGVVAVPGAGSGGRGMSGGGGGGVGRGLGIGMGVNGGRGGMTNGWNTAAAPAEKGRNVRFIAVADGSFRK